MTSYLKMGVEPIHETVY